MTAKPRVLLTGGAGTVGTALWQGWEAQNRFDLTLTDRRPIENSRSHSEIGELADYAFVEKICADQDVLVHVPPHPRGAARVQGRGADGGGPTMCERISHSPLC